MTHRIRAELRGGSLVAGTDSRDGTEVFRAVNPRTGQAGSVEFHEATDGEVQRAVAAASEAFGAFRSWDDRRRAALLHGIADAVEADRDVLVATASDETALPDQRLHGELTRTTVQLRAFADLLVDGWYVDAVIDPADPSAAPAPRPDLRRMLVPIGPIAVFGASNFPFAFSVPGGDTASALAAGCPVVAKAHPSHPGTSELAGRAILRALGDLDAPAGLFSLVHGRRPEVSRALVLAGPIRAVGFTGSYQAGRSLFELAAGRPEPIPVYAEMGSLNPVFVTRAALAARGAQIAEGFVASLTMGHGQFCTKPGLIFVPDGSDGDAFVQTVADRLGSVGACPLLNEGIRATLAATLAETTGLPGVDVVVRGAASGPGSHAEPSLLQVDGATFTSTPQLLREHFGPVSLVVRCQEEDFPSAAQHLEGNLTGAVHGEPADHDRVVPLVDALRERVGRLIWNGFPTGVAVTAAMHHGGPFPATTFPAHTSVGLLAIRRFLRPVAYQDFPPDLLPAALHDDNPLRIRRIVDGVFTEEARR